MLNQTQSKEIEKLFELGAHLGHKKNRLDPKARKNVYKIENGTSIIDLTKTVVQLEKAQNFLKEEAKKGTTILAVGTKKVASSILKDLASEKNIPYMTSKWLPGLLTNFGTLNKNVKNLTTSPFDIDSLKFPVLNNIAQKDFNAEVSFDLSQARGILRGTGIRGRTDTLYFEVYVKDFAKNKSNVIKTDKPFFLVNP